MSASEKLKALEAANRVPFTMTRLGITYDGIDYAAEDAHARLIALLPRALPQIVAVTNAAEKLSHFLENEKVTTPPPDEQLSPINFAIESRDDYEREEELSDTLAAALTALEETLS